MRRANPFAAWNERANWMIDVSEWLRREPRVSLLDGTGWQRVRSQRLRFLLDWLDENRDVRRVVQATLQKTLREAIGPELFSATGLPREQAFFGELSEKMVRLVLPRAPSQSDLSILFTAMFPDRADAAWLVSLDDETLSRVWKLGADDGIVHHYRRQIDEALFYLATMVIAAGISPAFRERLQPRLPIQSTPFMSLRRELEKYLAGDPADDAALRSVRMLIAVCQAQTDRIYEHLDEYGVSVGLVYHVERMRSQLARMARLIGLRAADGRGPEKTAQVQALLADLIHAHHHRSSIRGLVRRSFSLLTRKMVERNADHGEQYIARDSAAYRAMFKAACIGGALTVLTVLGKLAIGGAGLAHFFNGVFASLNYALSFLAITALGGVLATKQPAVTAPALAARMGALDTVDGLRSLVSEIAYLLRSQAAAVFGNLFAVVPTMLAACAAVFLLSGAPPMNLEKAQAAMRSFSLIGPAPLFAAFTGVLLWLAGLAAGFADNWFALRRVREGLVHHRRLSHALGPMRTARLAGWLERHVSDIAGSLSLAALLGMTPVVAQFFGLPLDVRHVTLSAGTLAAAAASLGWGVLSTPGFWLAAFGVGVIGLLNVGVAFACSLGLALHARDVPARVKRLVVRSVWRRFAASPRAFLFPERSDAAEREKVPETPPASSEEKPQRRRSR